MFNKTVSTTTGPITEGGIWTCRSISHALLHFFLTKNTTNPSLLLLFFLRRFLPRFRGSSGEIVKIRPFLSLEAKDGLRPSLLLRLTSRLVDSSSVKTTHFAGGFLLHSDEDGWICASLLTDTKNDTDMCRRLLVFVPSHQISADSISAG